MIGLLESFSRTKEDILTMKESDLSAEEIRNLLVVELAGLKYLIDKAYTKQLGYIEEVFGEI